MYTIVINPVWANLEHTKLNCQVNFNNLPEEFVNFTASPDDFEDYSKEIFTRAVNGEFGQIKEYEPPIIPLDQLKEFKKQEINTLAGNSRAKYITVIPGQESTYQFKLQEAQEYVNTDAPSDSDYPFLMAEAISTNVSLLVLAQSVLQTWNMWKPLAAKIEGIRRGAMVDINNATTVDEVMSINPIFP